MNELFSPAGVASQVLSKLVAENRFHTTNFPDFSLIFPVFFFKIPTFPWHFLLASKFPDISRFSKSLNTLFLQPFWSKRSWYKIKAMLRMLGGGENICGWLFMMELFTLGVSLHQKMTEAGTHTAEPVVILTVCLFPFVAEENEMQPSGLLPPLLPLSMENIANFEEI